MAYILKLFYLQYQHIMTNLVDPRTQDWFLVISIPKLAFCMFAWLWFVKDGGQKWMKNKEPFNLDKVLILYNLFQIFCCMFILYEAYEIVLFQYNWICEPVDYSTSKTALKMAGLVWMYYVLKIIDLLDTIFFVLRKKNNQMTFLHLYHHFGMVATCYVGVTWLPGGHVVYLGFINCVVHVVMYFYYLLSAWDKGYKQSAWWKKHITQLQLVQFMLVHCFYAPNLFLSTCPIPKFVSLYVVTQNMVMLLLFGDFYYKTYITQKPVQQIQAEKTEDEHPKPKYNETVLEDKTAKSIRSR